MLLYNSIRIIITNKHKMKEMLLEYILKMDLLYLFLLIVFIFRKVILFSKISLLVIILILLVLFTDIKKYFWQYLNKFIII